MNRYFKQLQKAAVDARTRNAQFFAGWQGGNPLSNPTFEGIWRDYDKSVSSIRDEIAETVGENLLPKSALSAYDELVRNLDILAGKRGGDFVDTPSASALLGAEAIIEAAPAL